AGASSSSSLAIRPEPNSTPKRVGSSCSLITFPSSRAICAAATASWMVRAITLSCLRWSLATNFLASKSRISPPMRVGRAEASKWLMGLTPPRPARRASQKAARPSPTGVRTPIPVSTVRRVAEAMARPRRVHRAALRACAVSRGSFHRRRGRLALLVLFLPPDEPAQQPLELAGEYEVLVAEHLLRPRLIQVGEEDFRLPDQFLADVNPAQHGCPFGPQLLDLGGVGQDLAGQRLAAEAGPRDLGEDDLLGEVVGLADQDAAGLCQ